MPGIPQDDIDTVLAAADHLDDYLNRTGQIGLITHPSSFWPLIIALVTRSPAYHVVIAVGGGQCIGAEPGGVKLRPITDFPYAVWSQFPFTRRQRLQIASWARRREGRPYDYLADLIIGIALLTRRHTPRWLETYLRSDKRWECAGLADAALTRAGIRVFRDHRPLGAVYPGSFVAVWADLGWWQLRD